MLTILQVAYPLAPVSPDTTGGAEQVLCHLERGLTARGYQTIVVASGDSDVSGRLVPLPRIAPPYDEAAIRAARLRTAAAIQGALDRWPVNLVHLHGFDFDSYLPPHGVPVLATLHCPASWYSPNALHPKQSSVFLNAVSRNQYEALLPNPKLLGFVENGVPVDAFATRHAQRNFALVLGRIAPDKGIREALLAAHMADIPMLIGGELFPYPEHEKYFREEIAPLLDQKRRYIGQVSFARKRRLLAAAKCVVISSLVPETSSLVLREALASGTPVVAFRRGALVDAIEPGHTGFLVNDIQEMAAAMRDASRIDPKVCRAIARERFSLDRMVEGYIDLYRNVLDRSATASAEAAQ